MTSYERVSTIIAVVAPIVSIGAAVVSLLTLYFTFFHKRAQLVGALVLLNERVSGVFDVEMEYVLCNTGNVHLLLKTVTPKVPIPSTDKKSTAMPSYNPSA